MDIVNACPKCGRPVELRLGRAVVVSKMRSIPRLSEYGEPMKFIPAVTCMLAECTSVEPVCDFAAAGHVESGVFMANRDFVPMARVLQMLMRYREQNGQHGPLEP